MTLAVVWLSVALLNLTIYVIVDKILALRKAKETRLAQEKAIQLVEEEIARVRANYEAQIGKLKKYGDTVEAVALAFNDLNRTGAGLIKVIRVDPDRVFEWGNR